MCGAVVDDDDDDDALGVVVVVLIEKIEAEGGGKTLKARTTTGGVAQPCWWFCDSGPRKATRSSNNMARCIIIVREDVDVDVDDDLAGLLIVFVDCESVRVEMKAAPSSILRSRRLLPPCL
jgi:hypothetical protein